MADTPSALDGVRGMWSGFAPVHKVALIATVVLVVGGVLALVKFADGGEYATLSEGLSNSDASRVVERLSTLKVPYKLTDAGSTIQVPIRRIDELRLQLAADGLLGSGSLGFEIFDKSQLGATGFSENVNLQRALEGELSRTIRSLAEVAAARVHLVLPKDRTFGLRKTEAKASVMIRLHAGRALEGGHVVAIQRLVAAAIQELEPAAVVVVDDRGDLLSRTDDEVAEARLNGHEVGEKQRLEERLSENVASLLTPLYGAGHFSSRVSADLDFSAVQETAELVDPEQRAMVSEQRTEERGGSATAGVGGVPGTASNIDENATKIPPQIDPSRLSETRNWEISKTVRHVTRPRFRLERLSLAVVIDSGAVAAETAPDPAEVQSLLAAAIGFDPQRGDQIEVKFLPFDVDTSDPAPLVVSRADQASDLLRLYGRPAGTALAALLGYFMLVRPLKKQALQALRAASRPALPAARQAAVGAGNPARAATPAERLAGAGPAAAVVPSSAHPVIELREAVVKSVSTDPGATARTIRGWLEGERQT